MKITVIGAGSTYTPELINGFINGSISGELPIKEITLMDIDRIRLNIVGEFCKRISEKNHAPYSIKLSTNLKDSIKGASFILTQFRVGGMEARHKDICLGRRYDMIGQETTGIGGFAKALRTAPVILKIADEIVKNASDAWLINFTNPVSIISQILIDYFPTIKWVGLCNGPKNLSMSIAQLLNLEDDSRLFLDYIGLNHLSWVRKVYLDGKDVTGKVLDKYTEIKKMRNHPEDNFNPELIKSIGMIPSPYLLYYYNQRDIINLEKISKTTRAQEVMKIEKVLLDMYQNPSITEKPEILSKRGGAYYSTVAIELMKSIHND